MAAPELFANSLVPGTTTALTTLSGNGGSISAGVPAIRVAAPAPASLQTPGQFRILIDQELMLVTSAAATTNWNVTRGIEGTTAATHFDGTEVFHVLTAGALNQLQQLGTVPAPKTATYNCVPTDGFVRMDTSGATLLVSLPQASACVVGQRITLKDVGTNAGFFTSVVPFGFPTGDFLDQGSTSASTVTGPARTNLVLLSGGYHNIRLKSAVFETDGVNTWYLVSALQSVSFTGSVEYFYPENYNCKADGTTDDTANYLTMLTAAGAAGNSVIKHRFATYNLAGNLDTSKSGNAMVALPSSFHRIVFEGHEASHINSYTGTVLKCGAPNGQAYSASQGPPSFIGGPTREALGNNSFNQGKVEFKNLNVILPSSTGVPTSWCGIDLSRISGGLLKNVGICAFNSQDQPTDTYQFGLRLSDYGNNGTIITDTTLVQRCFTALVISSAHTILRWFSAERCIAGIGLTGNAQAAPVSGINDPHSAFWTYVQTAHCAYHLTGWNHTGPPLDIPNNNPFYLGQIGNWDIEDANGLDGAGLPYPGWCQTAFHVFDNNDEIHGNAQFTNVLANVGIQTSRMPLTVRGGGNFILTNAAHPLGYLTGGGFSANPVSGTGYQNSFGDKIMCSLQYTLNPSGIASAGVLLELGPDTSSYQTFAHPSMPSNGPSNTDTLTFLLPSNWFFKATATNASLGTLKIIG